MTRTRNQQRGALLLAIAGLALLIPAPLPAQPVTTFKEHTLPVSSVCFSPDGKRLASASADFIAGVPGEVKVWDVQTAKEQLSLNKHTGDVSSVSFSPDGQRIISGSRDQTGRMWDARSGQEALSLKGHSGWVLSVCFSADGKRIVSGSEDRTVKVF